MTVSFLPPAPPSLARQVLLAWAVSFGVTLAVTETSIRLAALPGAFTVATAVTMLTVGLLAMAGLQDHCPRVEWGMANRVTLLRGALIALLAGGLAIGAPEPGLRWAAVLTGALALGLDGVDGWLARRQGLASDYGGQFDMNLDTLALVILTGLAWRWGLAGPWVLLCGLLRPMFVIAGWKFPWLRGELPYSQRRRIICAGSVGVLVFALAPLPLDLSRFASGAALGLLLYSFAVDMIWLSRHHRSMTLAVVD